MPEEQPPGEKSKIIIEPSKESPNQPLGGSIKIGKSGLPVNRRWEQMEEEKKKQEEELRKVREGLGINNEEPPNK